MARIITNWKKLVRKLMLREKLKEQEVKQQKQHKHNFETLVKDEKGVWCKQCSCGTKVQTEVI